MSVTDPEKVLTALRNADAAGDTVAAKRLATMYKELTSGQRPGAAAPVEEPSIQLPEGLPAGDKLQATAKRPFAEAPSPSLESPSSVSPSPSLGAAAGPLQKGPVAPKGPSVAPQESGLLETKEPSTVSDPPAAAVTKPQVAPAPTSPDTWRPPVSAGRFAIPTEEELSSVESQLPIAAKRRREEDVKGELRSHIAEPERAAKAAHAEYESMWQKEYGSLTPEQIRQKDVLVEGKKLAARKLSDSFNALEQHRAYLEGELKAKEELAKSATTQEELDSLREKYDADVYSYNELLKERSIMADAAIGLENNAIKEEAHLARRKREMASQQGTWGGAMWNSALKGTGGVVSGLADLEITAMSHLLPRSMLPGGADQEKTRSEISLDARREILPEARKALVTIAGDDDTTEEYTKRLEKGLIGGAVLGLTSSVPAMATPYMGGIFLQSFDGVRAEMEGEQWDDIPEAEKLAFAAGIGTVSAILERAGFGRMVANKPFVQGIMHRALKQVSPSATKAELSRILNAETNSAIKNILSRGVGGFAAEAETGGLQTLMEGGSKWALETAHKNKKLFAGNPDTWVSLFEDTGRGAVQEGIGGHIMTIPYALSSRGDARKNAAKQSLEQYTAMEGILSHPDYEAQFVDRMNADIKAGRVNQGEADVALQALQDAKGIIESLPEGLSPENRERAFWLIKEKQDLSKKDKNLVSAQLAEINTELAALAGVKPKEAAAPEAKTAAPAPAAAPPAPAITPIPDTPSPTAEWSGEDLKPIPPPTPPVTPVADAPAQTMEWGGRDVASGVSQTDPAPTIGRADIASEFGEPTVSEALGLRVRINTPNGPISGALGRHPEEKQTIVLFDDSGNMRDIGAVGEIGGKLVGDAGIEIEDRVGKFQMNEAGVINIGGVNYVAPKNTGHIERTSDGDVKSVTLPRATISGKPRKGEMTFWGDEAREIAYELTLREGRDTENTPAQEADLARERAIPVTTPGLQAPLHSTQVGGVQTQAPAQTTKQDGKVSEEGGQESPSQKSSPVQEGQEGSEEEVTPAQEAKGEPVSSPAATSTIQEFTTAQGSVYRVTPDGKTVRTKNSKGKGQGKTYEPHPVLFISPQDTNDLLDEANGPVASSVRLGYKKDGKFVKVSEVSEIPSDAQPLVAVVNKSSGDVIAEYIAKRNPEVGLNPVEKLYVPSKGIAKTHIGNTIVSMKSSESTSEEPTPKQRLQAMRSPSVQNMASEPSGNKKKPGRMTEALARKMASVFAPGIKIVKHDTVEGMRKAKADLLNKYDGKANRPKEEVNYGGFYHGASNEIHIGPEGDLSGILAHEVMHPLVNSIIKDEKGVTEPRAKALHDQLVTAGLGRYSEWAKRNYAGEVTQHVEAMVEYLGAVANGEFDAEFAKSKSFRDEIAKVIRKILEFFGINIPVNIKDVTDLKQIAKAVYDASTQGSAVNTGGLIPSMGGMSDSVTESRGGSIPSSAYDAAIDAALEATPSDADALTLAKATVRAFIDGGHYRGLGISAKKAQVSELKDMLASAMGINRQLLNKALPVKKTPPKVTTKGVRAAYKLGEKKQKVKTAEEKAKAEEQRKQHRERVKELRDGFRAKAKAMAEAAKTGRLAAEVITRYKERKAAAKAIDKALDEGFEQGMEAGLAEGLLEGGKAIAKEFSAARRAFAGSVRDLMFDDDNKPLIKGDKGRARAYSIGKKAAGIDPTNPRAVVRFLDGLAKSMAKASYVQDLANAKAAKKSIKTKNMAANHAGVLKAAKAIDVSLLADPAQYAEVIGEYAKAVRADVTSKNYVQPNSEELSALVQQWEKEVADAYEQMLQDELGITSEGFEGGPKKLYKEVSDAISGSEKMTKGEAEAEEHKALSAMAGVRKRMLSLHPKHRIKEGQRSMYDDLLAMDPKYMTNSDLKAYIKTVDNILENNSMAGAMVSAVKARMSAGFESSIPKVKNSIWYNKDGSPRHGLAYKLRQSVGSIADLMRITWEGNAAAGAEASGVAGRIRGHRAFSNAVEKMAKRFIEHFEKANKTPEGRQRGIQEAEGLVKYALQRQAHMTGDESLEVNKDIIRQQIARWTGPEALKSEKEKAVIAQEVYDKVLDKATTRAEVMDNLQKHWPGAKKNLDFMIGTFRDNRRALMEHVEAMYNDDVESAEALAAWTDEYYLPRSYAFTGRAVSGSGLTEEYEKYLDTTGPRSAATAEHKKASSLEERQRHSKLPEGKEIDLDARTSTLRSHQRDLYDLHVGAQQMFLHMFIESPFAERVMGSRNLSEFRDRVTAWTADVRREKALELSSSVARGLSRVQSMITVATLGKVVQAVPQLIQPLAEVLVKTGSTAQFKNVFLIQRAQALMDKYPTGGRGSGELGSYSFEGLEAAVLKEAEKHIGLPGSPALRRIDVGADWFRTHLLMGPLRIGDKTGAKAAWMTFYELKRREQGHSGPINWEYEAEQHDLDPERREAAMHAEIETTNIAGSADAQQASRATRMSGSLFERLGKAALLPFATFAIQSFSRKLVATATLHRLSKKKITEWTAKDQRDHDAAVLDLAASVAGDALFSATATLAAKGMVAGVSAAASPAINLVAQAIVAAMGDDEEDDEEEVARKDAQIAEYLAWMLISLNASGLMWKDIAKGADKMAEEKATLYKNLIEDKADKLNAERAAIASNGGLDPAELIAATMQEVEAVRGKAAREKAEKDLTLAVERFKTDVATKAITSGLGSKITDGLIELGNRGHYKHLVNSGDPSVLNPDGTTKSFQKWASDPSNTYLTAHAQGQPGRPSDYLGMFGAIPRSYNDILKAVDRIEMTEYSRARSKQLDEARDLLSTFDKEYSDHRTTEARKKELSDKAAELGARIKATEESLGVKAPKQGK